MADETWLRRTIVVGGGPAGLLAAWRLARRGVRVLLVDCGPPPHPADAAAGAFSLDTVGRHALGPTLAFDAERIGWRLTGRTTHRPGRGPTDRAFGPDNYGTALHRAAFRTLLADYARAAGVTLWWDSRATAVDARHGRVAVRRNGRPRTLRADLVIGADGPCGRTRSAVASDPVIDGHSPPRWALHARVPSRSAAAAGLAADRRHEFVAGDGTPAAVALPTTGGFELLLAVGGPHADAVPAAAAACALLATRCSRLLTLGRALPWQWVGRADVPAAGRLASCWHRGRLAFVGGTRRPQTVWLSTGTNLALDDARCLTEHVTRPGPGPHVALRAYQRQRQAAAQSQTAGPGRPARIDMGQWLGRLWHRDPPVGSAVTA